MLDTGSVPSKEYSDETARDIDAEISQLVEKAHERVRKMLTRGRRQLEIVAQELLEKETLTGDELRELVGSEFAAGKEDDSKEDDSIEMSLNRKSSVAHA